MLAADESLKFNVRLRANTDVSEFRLSATIFKLDGTPVGSWFSNTLPGLEKCSDVEYQVELAAHALAPGKYYVGIATGRGDYRTGHIDYDIILQVLHFEVRPPEGELGMVGHWATGWGAIIFKTPVITRMN